MSYVGISVRVAMEKLNNITGGWYLRTFKDNTSGAHATGGQPALWAAPEKRYEPVGTRRR